MNMKHIKFLLVCFALIFFMVTQSNAQWYADNRTIVIVGDNDPDWPIHVQFNNQNTGWVAHPSYKDSVYKTTNGGLNWFGYSTIDTNRMSGLFFVDNNTGWAVGQRGKIVKTTNSGITWSLQSSGVTTWLNDVRFANAQTGYIAGSHDPARVLLKTTNGGTNWFSLTAPGSTRLFAIALLSATSLYCVGDSGTIIYSSNGGTNWVAQSSGTTSTLRDIVFKTSTVTVGYIAGKNGIILSTTNGGGIWINRSFNTVNFYGIDFATVDTGYVCGRGRIYKTINGGINWTQQTTPVLDTINIKDIFCITSNNVWAVPWSGNLIYTTNGGVTKINSIYSEVPSNYSLNQNYPNPFNPSTKIQFAIPKNGFVKLTVFDITGKTMAVLANEPMQPGTYEVDWDASHRGSGVYFYKLETDNYSGTKRMVLIK